MHTYEEIKSGVTIGSEIVDEQGAICTIVEFDDDLEMLTVKYGDGMEMPLLPVQYKGLAKGSSVTQEPDTETSEPAPSEESTPSEEPTATTTAKTPRSTSSSDDNGERRKWFGPTPPQIMKIMETLIKRRPEHDPERKWDGISFGFVRSIRSVGDGIRVLDMLLGSDEPFSIDGSDLPVSTKQSRWAFNILTKDEGVSRDDANTIIASMTRSGLDDLLARHGKDQKAA